MKTYYFIILIYIINPTIFIENLLENINNNKFAV